LFGDPKRLALWGLRQRVAHTDKGEEMSKHWLVVAILASLFFLFAKPTLGQARAPLDLVKTIVLPPDITGHFDHFGIDLKGHRLFATPEDYKAILVFDLENYELIATIKGISRPHSVLYRGDMDRLFVTDGDAGELKIFDGKTYQLIKSVPLLKDADGIMYDPATKYLYIENGGPDVHLSFSNLSIIDTTEGTKLGDIKFDGTTLQAMAIEASTARLYVDNRDKHQVDVVDREKHVVIASWPITKGTKNLTMALDESNHRLFVGCRDGNLVVVDTTTGKELEVLPISKGVDDLVYDPATKRIYAVCDGTVDVYQQNGADNYKLLGKIISGPVAKTGRLVPELNKFFVAVPAHDRESARILVYEVH
jgi:DNA-binding beta-propeller fold protein YncE